jgi:putative phosphoesterase
MLRIGLISDTHGLLRPEAIAFLQGCDHIIHGGDVHKPSVLEELVLIAPVTTVRGNNDKGAWASDLPETELVQLGGKLIYVIHDISQIDIDPGAAQVDVVVYGHSHKPSIEVREEVIYINPGSAGPRRFRLPISVGELLVSDDGVIPRIVEFNVPENRTSK